MTTHTEHAMKPWQKRTLITLFILLTFVTLIWNLIPTATKWFVNRYTQQHDVSFSADTINPNIFPIGLELGDVKLLKDSIPLFTLNHASIGLDFMPLLKGEFHVNHVEVTGLDTQVENQNGVMTIAGLSLPQNPDKKAEAPAETAEPANEQSIPTFFIHDAQMQDISVRYLTERGEDTFYLNSLNVIEVSHNMDDWMGQLVIEAGLNQAQLIAAGEVKANGSEIDTYLDLKSLSLSTSDVQNFVPKGMEVGTASNVQVAGSTNVIYRYQDTPQFSLMAPLLQVSSGNTALTQVNQELGWANLNTRVENIQVEGTGSQNLSVKGKAALDIKGLSIHSGEQSLSTKSLAFNGQTELKKDGADIELANTTSQLETQELQGTVNGNKLSLGTLKAELANLGFKFNTDSQQGEGQSTLSLTSDNLTAETTKGESASLGQLSFSSPVALKANETKQQIATDSFELALTELNLGANSGTAQLSALTLNLLNTKVTQSDEGQNFSTELALDTQGIKGSLMTPDSQSKQPAQAANLDSLTLNTVLSGSLSGTQELTLQGDKTQLQLGGAAYQSDAQDISLDRLDWSLNNMAAQLGGDSTALSGESGLQLSNLKASLTQLPNNQPDTDVSLESLTLNNSLDFLQQGEQTAINNTANSIDMSALSVSQSDTLEGIMDELVFSSNELKIELGTSDQATHINTSDNTLNISTVNVELADGSTLTSWDELALDNPTLSVNGTDISADVNSFKLQQFVASQPNADSELPALATFDQLDINRIALRPEGIEIASLVVDKLASNLVLAENQRIENLMLPSSVKSSDVASTEEDSGTATESETNNSEGSPSEETTPDYYVVIGKIILSPESTMTLVDRSIVPTLKRDLTIDELTVDNLNTRDDGAQTYVVLKARNGRYASLDGTLTIEPTAAKLTMDAKAKVREVELPPISPYVANVLGYNIASGQLNMDLNVTANQGQLNGNSHIVLRQFDLGGKKDSNTVLKAGAIPLNLAVGALKDGDDNIVLDLPLKGDINSPQFQWQNFFLLPVRQGLYKASSIYVMQTFVPYANVISLAQLAGEQVLRLRVQPLNFEYGETEVNDEQSDFLTQLIALMNDRPQAELRACGVAVAKDLDEDLTYDDLQEGDEDKLYGIANERAESLKAYLVDNEIPSSRIFICSPTVDEDQDAQPRVTLTF